MFKNYLKISLRNLVRHKAFSFINIFGLALSMSVCLLIIMLVKDAYDFDRFHPDGDRVYRVNTIALRKDGGTESYASSPFPVGSALQNASPQIDARTPLVRSFNGQMRVNEEAFPFNGMFSDASFFDMFGFTLARGDVRTALNAPYTIVLTHDMANAIFNAEDPLGRSIEIRGYLSPFTVTGVLDPFPGKTHLDFSALGSLETQLAEERQNSSNRVTDQWTDYYQTYNFIRLKEHADLAEVKTILDDLAHTQYANLELESRDKGYQFEIQSLHDITPGKMISNQDGKGMPRIMLVFLSILGAILMLCACFNYTNLTIARSLVRTREIGVRKVLGASRKQVMGQILGEAVVTAFLSLIIAYILLKLVKPQFERLSIAEALDMHISEDLLLYGLFAVFTIVVGVIAGILPALTLSRTSPAAVLQKLQNLKLIQRIGLRKALLTTQFAVTMVFLMTLTIAWRQTDHAISQTFGFDQPQTLLVKTYDVPYETAASTLAQVSGVELISGISFPMGTWQDASDDIRTDVQAEKSGVREYFIDHKYLHHFNINLVAGENFPNNISQQHEQFALVNEKFVQQFNLGTAPEAIGKSLFVGEDLQLVIRGVTEDFPFKPAVYSLEPLLLRYEPSELHSLNLKLNSQNIPATVGALERAWKTLNTQARFDGTFYDEEVRANYSEATDLLRVVGFFGVLGIVIVCIGLLGLTTYAVETKAREISIRKIMGATTRDIVVFLSRGYLMLFAIAILISVPLSYLVGDQILQSFAQRVSMSALLFIPGIAIMLLLTGLTVVSQTLKAAFSHPVESLRSE